MLYLRARQSADGTHESTPRVTTPERKREGSATGRGAAERPTGRESGHRGKSTLYRSVAPLRDDTLTHPDGDAGGRWRVLVGLGRGTGG
jgi:hypothetical protein